MARAILVLALLWSIPATAWAEGPAGGAAAGSPMLRYLGAAGIESQLEAQREKDLAHLKKQLDALLDQMAAQLPDVPAGFREEMEPLLAELVKSIARSYTVREALAVYAAPFDREYPGGALDPALRELSTADGRKLVSTLSQAISDVSEFRRVRAEAAMQEATTRLIHAMEAARARRAALESHAVEQGVEADAE